MATITAAATSRVSLFIRPSSSLASSFPKVVSFRLTAAGLCFPALRSSRFRVSCVAKPETVDKVFEIVRKQLALPPETELTPESKFATLGADSLDTVEIVMALEEEFGIGVEEESSQNITTVQEVADLIEKLVQKKPDPVEASALLYRRENEHDFAIKL